MTHVVFDIGGVLVDWQPHLAWADDLGEDGAFAFMERTGFRAKNARADAGERFADLAREIDAHDDARLFAEYVDRYPRTVQNRIDGTWRVLNQLRDQGTPVHAITNWSHETWPRGLQAQPQLGEVFETLVVSGQERVMKPERRIFELFCARAGVAADACLFSDDGAYNVAGAQAAGMDGIHFTTPDALRTELEERGVL